MDKQLAIKRFEELADAVGALRDVVFADDVLEGGGIEPTPGRLNVPWIGQNVREVTTDDFSNSDCGPACVAMWLAYRGLPITVDEVSQATGLSRGYTYTLPAHLITAARKYHLPLARYVGVSQVLIKQQIDAGNPLIVLVHYGSLARRYSNTFTAGHWIIVTGYSGGGILYNDPLAQDETGKAISISWDEFDKAMSDCSRDGNTPRQCLLMV